MVRLNCVCVSPRLVDWVRSLLVEHLCNLDYIEAKFRTGRDIELITEFSAALRRANEVSQVPHFCTLTHPWQHATSDQQTVLRRFARFVRSLAHVIRDKPYLLLPEVSRERWRPYRVH